MAVDTAAFLQPSYLPFSYVGWAGGAALLDEFLGSSLPSQPGGTAWGMHTSLLYWCASHAVSQLCSVLCLPGAAQPSAPVQGSSVSGPGSIAITLEHGRVLH